MQILRIILMVCFVFTVYPSIGEAQSGVAINKGGDEPPASDPLTIETTSQTLRAELPLGVEDVGVFESKESQHGLYLNEIEAEERSAPVAEQLSASEPTHLNERILQLQKKELDKSLDTPTEDDGY